MALDPKLLERIKNAQKDIKTGSKYLNLESGKPVSVHVLPGEFGEHKLFFKKVGYYYLGDDNFVSPYITEGHKDPVWEMIQDLRDKVSSLKREADDTKDPSRRATLQQEADMYDKIVSDLYPSTKYLMNVLPEDSKQPLIFNTPVNIFNTVFEQFQSNAVRDGVDILNPENSYLFEFSKQGSTRNDIKYKASIRIHPRPIGSNADEIKTILDACTNLDSYVKIPTDDELASALAKHLNLDDTTASSEQSAPPPPPEPEKPADGGMSPAALLKAKLSGNSK